MNHDIYKLKHPSFLFVGRHQTPDVEKIIKEGRRPSVYCLALSASQITINILLGQTKFKLLFCKGASCFERPSQYCVFGFLMAWPLGDTHSTH